MCDHADFGGIESMYDIRSFIREHELKIKTTGKGRTKVNIIVDINQRLAMMRGVARDVATQVTNEFALQSMSTIAGVRASFNMDSAIETPPPAKRRRITRETTPTHRKQEEIDMANSKIKDEGDVPEPAQTHQKERNEPDEHVVDDIAEADKEGVTHVPEVLCEEEGKSPIIAKLECGDGFQVEWVMEESVSTENSSYAASVQFAETQLHQQVELERKYEQQARGLTMKKSMDMDEACDERLSIASRSENGTEAGEITVAIKAELL